VKLRPAIVSAVVRVVVAPFAATFTVTPPLPVPPVPVNVAHASPMAAVQEQPLPAVTATVTDPPSAVKLRLVGEIEYVQGTGALCVTVTA
jgi:hypothetical protein